VVESAADLEVVAEAADGRIAAQAARRSAMFTAIATATVAINQAKS
jgi:hypothetical protein